MGEGIRNVFKNKKSTISALVIMCATMIVFGVLFLISENINDYVKEQEDNQGIQVFMYNNATEDEIDELESQLRNIGEISGVTKRSKQDSLEQVAKIIGDADNADAFYELYGDAEIFGVSFIVNLHNLDDKDVVKAKIEKLDNVKEISLSDNTIETLSSFAKGIKIVTYVLLALIIVISTFIISNTIKLTVHARRKEISIMKYVGATNNFIRFPFVVEGIILGLIAASISIVLVGLVYTLVVSNLGAFISKLGITLAGFADMFDLIMGVYLAMGVGIGVFGSVLSMRKYLKV
jgi:cell division transport system permease protein